ncbi:MAG: L,D-transpeptidase family protein [Myxococcota bacterium]
MDLVPEQGLVVVVDKSDFVLGVYRDGKLIEGPDGSPACFPVALGADPVGDKVRQGDERTPEGTFRVTHRNPRSAFHLSLGLNYPDAAHAEKGHELGIIDAATRDRVVAADRARQMPVRTTRLGGDIYIHGGGPLPRWWTDGCIAVSNDVMDWLFVTVGPGTRVRIDP